MKHEYNTGKIKIIKNYKIGISSLLLLLVCSLFIGMTACSPAKQEFVFVSFSDYSISENDTTLPFQFAYSEHISDISVENLQYTGDATIEYEFIDEKDASGKSLKYKDYFIYGIIFNINASEDLVFNSFEIVINNEFEKEIVLDLSIFYREEQSDFDDIRPLSIPYVCEYGDDIDWTFLVVNNIEIQSIELIAAELTPQKMYFNSIEFDQVDNKNVKALEKIYIDMEFNSSRANYNKEKVFIKIKYTIDGDEREYISDYSIIGTLRLLEEKIDSK